jgi:hypothetical protein
MYCKGKKRKPKEPESVLLVEALQVEDNWEHICERFMALKPNAGLDDPKTKSGAALVAQEYFCNIYSEPTELIWAIGTEGENCMEVCLSGAMIVQETVLPRSKEAFENIVIKYEASSEQDLMKLREVNKPVTDYCSGGISNDVSSAAPEVDKNGYCLWISNYLNQKKDTKLFRAQKPTRNSMRRICPCLERIKDDSTEDSTEIENRVGRAFEDYAQIEEVKLGTNRVESDIDGKVQSYIDGNANPWNWMIAIFGLGSICIVVFNFSLCGKRNVYEHTPLLEEEL